MCTILFQVTWVFWKMCKTILIIWSISLQDQPQCTPKSKIPVLRSSSVKVPREICFGYGVNRSFSQRISNWYQKNSQPSNVTLKSIDKSNFDDMKMALDWGMCPDISPNRDEKPVRSYWSYLTQGWTTDLGLLRTLLNTLKSQNHTLQILHWYLSFIPDRYKIMIVCQEFITVHWHDFCIPWLCHFAW